MVKRGRAAPTDTQTLQERTMNTRKPALIGFLGGLALTATLALGALAGFAFGPQSAQAQTVATGTRQVTVVGTGETRVAPDMATVQIGVENTAATTREALAQNTAQARAVIDKIKELGVADKDIQTSGFNIYATYNNDGRTITGYTVSNTVVVTIRDLAKAGDLLDKVVQSGANRVYGVSFGVSDPKAAMAQARDAAMADARARAEQLARAGGAQLGLVLVINENIGAPPVLPLPAMGRAEAMDAAVPVQAGEQAISASVQVTYALR
jgi:uncharacterized protein YggE